jgi:hypothetical protein
MIIREYEAKWPCGHRWLGRDTTMNPENSLKCAKMSCIYCSDKRKPTITEYKR